MEEAVDTVEVARARLGPTSSMDEEDAFAGTGLKVTVRGLALSGCATSIVELELGADAADSTTTGVVMMCTVARVC